MSFYSMVQQDIGPNSEILDGLCTFGMSMVVVKFIALYNSPFSKYWRTAFVTSSPIMGHALLKKKKALKPSQPGAL